jgi:hypothetical protein
MNQNKVNDSYYQRNFSIYYFHIEEESESEYKTKLYHNSSLALPKFLSQIPHNYFVNAILNYHSTECLYCNHSVYLFLIVNAIPKYCQTLMDTLSTNV